MRKGGLHAGKRNEGVKYIMLYSIYRNGLHIEICSDIVVLVLNRKWDRVIKGNRIDKEEEQNDFILDNSKLKRKQNPKI